MADYKKALFELLDQGAYEDVIDCMECASVNNRVDTEVSTLCGCFSCGAVFSRQEIVDWTDDGHTAICPRCSANSVIPDTQGGYSVSEDFLAAFLEFRASLPAWRHHRLAEENAEPVREYMVFAARYRDVTPGISFDEDSACAFSEVSTMAVGDIWECEPDDDPDVPSLMLAILRDKGEFIVLSGLDGSFDMSQKLEPGAESRLWFPEGESYGMWEFGFSGGQL